MTDLLQSFEDAANRSSAMLDLAGDDPDARTLRDRVEIGRKLADAVREPCRRLLGPEFDGLADADAPRLKAAATELGRLAAELDGLLDDFGNWEQALSEDCRRLDRRRADLGIRIQELEQHLKETREQLGAIEARLAAARRRQQNEPWPIDSIDTLISSLIDLLQGVQRQQAQLEQDMEDGVRQEHLLRAQDGAIRLIVGAGSGLLNAQHSLLLGLDDVKGQLDQAVLTAGEAERFRILAKAAAEVLDRLRVCVTQVTGATRPAA
ncbi:hypothetical protein ACFP3U_35225 [Kitasatospora misakiensis]|uniref:Uncharacterized protein n=1 Tax=Kitasatospora misakiensis TaxID=67330 RepID=A0ABW0XCA4_9ACTN